MISKYLKMPVLFFILVILLILIAGCTESPSAATPQPTQGTQPEVTTVQSSTETASTNISYSVNQFSADFYERMAKDPTTGTKNLFYSPYSISSALALTYEGAEGTTANEIRSVFSFPANKTALRSSFLSMNSGINQENNAYTLTTANALWAERTFTFLPDYTSVAQQYYSANTTNLDFANEPDASRQMINQWVASKTNDKIQDLLPTGSIDTSTKLVITNAVYFKGIWEKQFDPNLTVASPFTRPDGTTISANMMQRTGESAVYPYAETANLQMLSMPYSSSSGVGLSMIVLLPRENSLSVITPYLDPVNLSALEQSASSRRVDVYVPKFKIETEYSLKNMLSEMGMPTAFSSSADFSGMDGKPDLYISDVHHKAYIEVNEQGTEAAAATGVVVNAMAVAPGPSETIPVFRADHPFYFIIQENKSGAILFAGQVTDPSVS